MTDVASLQASMSRLSAAANAVDDPMFKMQLNLTMNVLSNAVAGAAESLNPATVNDIEFALNDVIGTVGELNAADADAITPALEAVKADVAALKNASSLPPQVIKSIRDFQAKLRERRSAIQKQQYRAEGTEAEPLPHPPEGLRDEAFPLRRQLSKAGFATPLLDEFIGNPSSLVFQKISDILDELDVITG